MHVRHAWYAGLCSVCGLEVSASGPESGLPMIEIGRQSLRLSSYARFLTVAHGTPHRITYADQDGDKPFSVAYEMTEDGHLTTLGHVYSRSGVGFLPDGRTCYQDTRSTYRVTDEPKSWGIPAFTPTVPGVSNTGFSGDPQVARNWYDQSYVAPLIVRGQRIFVPSWSPDGDWVCGPHGNPADRPDRNVYLLHRVSTGELWEGGETFRTQTEGRLVMRDGLPVWVRSYPSGLIPFSEFKPYVGEPVPKIDALGLVGVGLFFDSGITVAKAPMPGQSGETDPRMPVTERTPVIFCTVNHPEENIPGTWALVKKYRRVPVFYRDGQPIEVGEVPKANGFKPWAGICCYPNVPLSEIRKAIVAHQAADSRVALIVPAYCQWGLTPDGRDKWTWTEDQIVNRLWECAHLVREFHIRFVLGFAGHREYNQRLVDGVAYWPAIAETWARFRSASTNWMSFPDVEPVSASAPTPTPVPVPTPLPTPQPSDEEDMTKFTAITKNPINAGFPDEGFVNAEPGPHQDAGFISVKVGDKFRNVGDNGTVEDNRASAGGGERFTFGVGATVIARRKDKVFVFGVA